MYEITSTDARMIRTADSICFDTSHGAGRIRAIIRGNEHEHERTYSVPVEATRLQDYSGGAGEYTAFAMLMSARHDDVARTLVRHIRKGSRVGLVWTRGNASPVTEAAGVVVDHLDVKVQNGKVCDTFRVSTFIGYDNSARMIRRA